MSNFSTSMTLILMGFFWMTSVLWQHWSWCFSHSSIHSFAILRSIVGPMFRALFFVVENPCNRLLLSSPKRIWWCCRNWTPASQPKGSLHDKWTSIALKGNSWRLRNTKARERPTISFELRFCLAVLYTRRQSRQFCLREMSFQLPRYHSLGRRFLKFWPLRIHSPKSKWRHTEQIDAIFRCCS